MLAALSNLRIYKLRVLRSSIAPMARRFVTVLDFVTFVGRARFERELGHSQQVISRAVSTNRMPAHWYFACRDWCREMGITVPEHLFRQCQRPNRANSKRNANFGDAA